MRFRGSFRVDQIHLSPSETNGKACTSLEAMRGTPSQQGQGMAPATWPPTHRTPSSSTGYASLRAAISHYPEALLLSGAVIYDDELFNVVFGA